MTSRHQKKEVDAFAALLRGAPDADPSQMERGKIGADVGFDPTKGAPEFLKLRRMDLTSGINFASFQNAIITEEQIKYGKLLGWVRLILAALYAVTALAFLFVVIFETDGRMRLYTDPTKWSSLDKKWEVALEEIGVINIDWALLALFSLFSVYHAAHFIPFVRDYYLKLVFYFQANPIRWTFHGVVGGIMLTFYALLVGVSGLPMMFALLLIIFGATACVLYSELINKPIPLSVKKGMTDEEKRDWIAQVTAMYNHTPTMCDANVASKNEYYLVPAVVSPLPIIGAVVLMAGFIGLVSYYFIVAAADQPSKLPWFVWTTYLITVLSIIVMAIVNVARLAFNFKFLQNYFYVDLLHNGVELVLIYATTVAILIGLAL